MLKEQQKQLLIGGAVAAFVKFYWKRDTKTALLWGAAAIVTLAVYDSLTTVTDSSPVSA